MTKRILVIRLGALGDMVLSFPAFAAIRAHHAADHITLLTTAPFASLAADSPWFDAIRIDARPRWTDLPAVLRLRRQLTGFDFTYDLQTSGRSTRYFLARRPPTLVRHRRRLLPPGPRPEPQRLAHRHPPARPARRRRRASRHAGPRLAHPRRPAHRRTLRPADPRHLGGALGRQEMARHTLRHTRHPARRPGPAPRRRPAPQPTPPTPTSSPPLAPPRWTSPATPPSRTLPAWPTAPPWPWAATPGPSTWPL